MNGSWWKIICDRCSFFERNGRISSDSWMNRTGTKTLTGNSGRKFGRSQLEVFFFLFSENEWMWKYFVLLTSRLRRPGWYKNRLKKKENTLQYHTIIVYVYMREFPMTQWARVIHPSISTSTWCTLSMNE